MDKSTPRPNLQQAFHRILDSVKQLPSPPEVCLAVTRAAQSDETNLGEIQALVENDIALSAKLMQVANSAFFGVREPVKSVRKAISLLGFNTVKSLALGFFFNEQFGKLRLPGLPYPDLPRYALATSCINERLAQRIEPARASEAGCLGLLHESGVMVMAMAFGNQYKSAVSELPDSHLGLHEMETQRFGVNHALAGQVLFKNWQLGEPLVTAVGYQHQDQPPDQPEPRIVQMWRICRVGSSLALCLFGDPPQGAAESALTVAEKHLDWNGQDVVELLTESLGPYRQRTAVLQIDPGEIEADCSRGREAVEALRQA